MSTRLHIGILDATLGWVILLRQIGVPYERMARFDAVRAGDIAAVIVNRALSTAERASVKRFLQSGGAILDTGHFLGTEASGTIGELYVETIIPDVRRDELFAGIAHVDIHAWTHPFVHAQYLNGTVYIGSDFGGTVAHIAIDIDDAFVDTRSRRKRFAGPGDRLPDETVSTVSKGSLRRVVERVLQTLYHRRDLPFLHRWYFPAQNESAFLYRIDSDFGSAEECRRLYQVAKDHNISMTWFLHVGAHEQFLEQFRAYTSQEFAVHGYRHKTYDDYQSNFANMSEAMQIMQHAGLEFTGFAAPNGHWSHDVQRAIENHGFVYSSEFSLNYDDVPCAPAMFGHESRALQIPVHPICIGSLLNARYTTDQMCAYHRMVIDEHIASNLPVAMYHHPTHGSYDVVADTFRYVRQLGVPNLTFGQYAEWWQMRQGCRSLIAIDDGTIHARCNRDTDDVSLRVVMPDLSEGFMGLNGSAVVSTLPMRQRTSGTAGLANARQRRGSILRDVQRFIEEFNIRIRQ